MGYMYEILEDFGNDVIRYCKYNKFNIWTPEQQEKKYIDESIYEDTHYTFGRVVNAWDTNKGILLKIEECDNEYPYESYERSEYIYLNDINLVKFDYDQKEHEDIYGDLDGCPFI